MKLSNITDETKLTGQHPLCHCATCEETLNRAFVAVDAAWNAIVNNRDKGTNKEVCIVTETVHPLLVEQMLINLLYRRRKQQGQEIAEEGGFFFVPKEELEEFIESNSQTDANETHQDMMRTVIQLMEQNTNTIRSHIDKLFEETKPGVVQ